MTVTKFMNSQMKLKKLCLCNDTIKRMNNLGQQDVEAPIGSFQCQEYSSSDMFVHEYEFYKQVQGFKESFDKFYNDLQKH